METTIIKSASIILRRTTGEVYLVKRSRNVSFFPGFWVFPGGKIEHELPEDWTGTEPEVIDTIFQELFEEVGVILGSDKVIPSGDRSGLYLDYDFDPDLRHEIKEKLTYIGKKQTPPFRRKMYNAAYFLLEDDIVDTLKPMVDDEELVKGEWKLPQDAIRDWENGELKLPPPILHILRNLTGEHPVMKTLVETDLPVGLQTKVEFVPGYQLIPISSNTIDPFFNTNLTIIESEDDILLVDPGARPEAYDHLKQILLSLTGVPKVFITHHHKDHWEGLSVVEEIYPDAELYIHPQTEERISTTLTTIKMKDGTINVGKKNLQLLSLPGHTDTHQILYDQDQDLVVAGDHVVGFGSAVLDPEYGNMKDYFDSTERLLNMNLKLIFPSHGPPSFAPNKLLTYYIKHRTEREDSILDAIMDGNYTLQDIVEVVYQDVPEKMWSYAKHNIRLHIEKLREENRLPDEFLSKTRIH